MSIIFGKPIPVDGAKPDWLHDDEKVQWTNSDGTNAFTLAGKLNWEGKGGSPVVSIKIRNDHDYYKKEEKQMNNFDAIPDWALLKAHKLSFPKSPVLDIEFIRDSYDPYPNFTETQVLFALAKYISEHEEPVDPILQTAREFYANRTSTAAKITAILDGKFDDDYVVIDAVGAIKLWIEKNIA